MDDLIQSQVLRSGAYVAGAAVCAIAALQWSRNRRFANGWLFWAGAACLMLSFGLLKVIGVEDILQDTGRDIADLGGIYEVRRGYQLVLILAIVWSGLLWLAGFVIALRQQMLRSLLPGLMAVTTLACYVFARGVSHHDVDTVLYRREFLGVQPSALIEVLLTGFVIAVAIYAIQTARPGRPPEKTSSPWLGRLLRLLPLRP